LRQFLKRAVPFFVGDFTFGGSGIQLNTYSMEYYPYYLFGAGVSASTTIASGGAAYPFVPDYYTIFGALYSVFRGSVRVKRTANALPATLSLSGTVATRPTAALPAPFTYINNAGQFFITAGASNFPLPFVPYDSLVYPYPEIQLPYYSPSHVSVLHWSAPGTNSNDVIMPHNVISQTLSLMSIAPASITLTAFFGMSRQIGEDFDFGFFTGTVPLCPTAGLSGGAGTYNYLAF